MDLKIPIQFENYFPFSVASLSNSLSFTTPLP